MTLRAVLLGLLGAVFVCAFTYFNDQIMRQTFLVGSSMPPAVFGGLLVVLVLVNPGLAYLRKRWAFTRSELAVALALTLAACCIPSLGLMGPFTNTLMMPHRQARLDASWQATGALEMLPEYMLADISGDEDRALNGYVQGLPRGRDSISAAEVPWGAWTRTLLFWLPLVLLVWLALVGLSLVIHRRWSDHERLPYPIAAFAQALLPGSETERPVYVDRLFWWGCGVVCLIHLLNYLATWWPGSFVTIPRHLNFGSLAELLPTLREGGGWQLLYPTLYFTIIGLAYFLPTDLSLSVGVGPFLFCSLAGVLAGFGISMSGGSMYDVSPIRALHAGAYAGMLVLVLYTGRRYYASALRAALGLRPAERVGPEATWGARLFLISTIVIVLVLTAVGLDWQLALAFTVLSIAMFVVIARISAETGYIWIMPCWEPAAVIVGFLGFRAMGPSTALLMFFLSAVLLTGTREVLVAFLLNSFKVLDAHRINLSRSSALCILALVIGLAVAVPVTLYLKYDRGTDLAQGYLANWVPRCPFDEAVRIKQRLATQGRLAEAESISGFARLLELSPDRTLLAGCGAAFLFFLLLSAARLRFPSWPLHPAMLLVWGTYPGMKWAASFLIGFLIKWAVVKYGGDKAFRRLKPLMFGVIAGDMLTGVVTSAIGAIYYLATGTPPPRFVVLVG